MGLLLIIRLLGMISIILLILIMVWYVQRISSRFGNAKAKGKAKIGDLPADDGVRQLVAQGKLEEAIDLYRQFTGVDVFTAREAVRDMERELRLSHGTQQEIKRLLNADKKAAAIEAYQTATGANLEEALAYVETMQEGKRK